MTAPTPLLAPVTARVDRAEQHSEDTVTLRVRTADGALEPAQPGQFDMVTAIGVGEAPISLSGDTDEAGIREYTFRAVGTVTRALASLAPGAPLGIRGPFGVPWPLHAAQGGDVLVLAGGLGLAPVRPAILRILATRQRYLQFTVAYGARAPAELLFTDDLRAWADRDDVKLAVTVDERTPAGSMGPWCGHTGVITTLVDQLHIHPDAVTALVCGPEVMMRCCTDELLARGLPADRIHLSLERSMVCGVGLCGHCQLGPLFVCTDGPVLRHDRLAPWLAVASL